MPEIVQVFFNLYSEEIDFLERTAKDIGSKNLGEVVRRAMWLAEVIMDRRPDDDLHHGKKEINKDGQRGCWYFNFRFILERIVSAILVLSLVRPFPRKKMKRFPLRNRSKSLQSPNLLRRRRSLK